MADDDPGRHAKLVRIGRKAQTQGLDAKEVDLLLQDPAGVVLTKPVWLDERCVLESKGVGDEISAGREGHGRSGSWVVWGGRYPPDGRV